jgi:hypothetical protein
MNYGDMISTSHAEMVEPERLTDDEARSLAELEETVRRGFATFVEVGLALTAIRDGRLWRESHGSFEKYVAARWKMSRPRAYELMAAAKVVVDLVHDTAGGAPRLTPNARQARELHRLPAGERETAWSAVLDAAGDGPVTAALVRSEVDRRLGVDRASTTARGQAPADPPRCPVCQSALNDGFRAPELQCDGTREGCKMPDLAAPSAEAATFEHYIDERPGFLESEQEYRGACACGEVFGGPDEESVTMLLDAHVAQQRQQQAAQTRQAGGAPAPGWLEDGAEPAPVVKSAAPAGATADIRPVTEGPAEADRRTWRALFNAKLIDAQEAIAVACGHFQDPDGFARQVDDDDLDELDRWAETLTGFVTQVRLARAIRFPQPEAD